MQSEFTGYEAGNPGERISKVADMKNWLQGMLLLLFLMPLMTDEDGMMPFVG